MCLFIATSNSELKIILLAREKLAAEGKGLRRHNNRAPIFAPGCCGEGEWGIIQRAKFCSRLLWEGRVGNGTAYQFLLRADVEGSSW